MPVFKSIEMWPNWVPTRANLACAYIGLAIEARVQAAEVLRINPNSPIVSFNWLPYYRDESMKQQAISSMRGAVFPRAAGGLNGTHRQTQASAILMADVVEYGRLLGQDEPGTGKWEEGMPRVKKAVAMAYGRLGPVEEAQAAVHAVLDGVAVGSEITGIEDGANAGRWLLDGAAQGLSRNHLCYHSAKPKTNSVSYSPIIKYTEDDHDF